VFAVAGSVAVGGAVAAGGAGREGVSLLCFEFVEDLLEGGGGFLVFGGHWSALDFVG